MRELVLNKKKYQLYDSIDELPIVNFQKYNKYVLFDSHIGSDINAVDTHLANLAKLIKTDKLKAARELQNLRTNLYFIVNNISPKYMAFATLIHSIDGKKLEDLSDDNLKKIIEDISTVKRSRVIDFLLKFKKKLNTELSLYFPASFNDAKSTKYYDCYKQKANLMLDAILTEEDREEAIEIIADQIFSFYNPQIFSGKDSVEVKHDKQFETGCLLICQKTGMNAKSMTVLEYYAAIENINKQVEAESKAYSRLKHK